MPPVGRSEVLNQALELEAADIASGTPSRLWQARDILGGPLPPPPHTSPRDQRQPACWTCGESSHFRGNCPYEAGREDDGQWRRNDRRSESERKPERKTTETAGTQHPECIGLERPGDHAERGPSAAGRNGPSTGSVGASIIVGGTANRDAPRHILLKGMIDLKQRTRKKKGRRKRRVQHSCLLVTRLACVMKTAMTVYTSKDE
jgi:hypothetical protein